MVKLLFMSDGSISKSLDRTGEVPTAPQCFFSLSFSLFFPPWEPHSTDPELSHLKTFNKRLWMTDGNWEEAEGKGWSGKVPAGTGEGGKQLTSPPPPYQAFCAGVRGPRNGWGSSTWSTNAGMLSQGCEVGGLDC